MKTKTRTMSLHLFPRFMHAYDRLGSIPIWSVKAFWFFKSLFLSFSPCFSVLEDGYCLFVINWVAIYITCLVKRNPISISVESRIWRDTKLRIMWLRQTNHKANYPYVNRRQRWLLKEGILADFGMVEEYWESGGAATKHIINITLASDCSDGGGRRWGFGICSWWHPSQTCSSCS